MRKRMRPANTPPPSPHLPLRETNRQAGEYMWTLFSKEVPAITSALDAVLRRQGRLRKQMGYEIITELVLRAPNALKPHGPMSSTLAFGLRNNKRIWQVGLELRNQRQDLKVPFPTPPPEGHGADEGDGGWQRLCARL